MPDLDKPSGQDMLLKPPEEFRVRKQHLLGFGTVSVVLVAESDVGVIDFKYPVSGDCYFMGIPSKVFDYTVGRTEGGLGIDVPFFEPDGFEDSVFVRVPHDGRVFFQEIHEYGLVHFGHAFLRKEKAVVFAFCLYPLDTVRPSCADNAVDMGMERKVLSPGMEHHGDAGFCPEVFRHPGMFQQGLGSCLKQ